MASSNDVRDMLGLAAAGEKSAKPPPLKKQKSSHKPLRGMNREVHALIGERAAPVAIIDPSKTYQRKLGPKRKAKQWVQQPFRNPARIDGLILKHWVPKPLAQQQQRQQTQDGGDTAMEDVENRNPEAEAEVVPLDEDYKFAKYNVQVETPSYDDEQYDAQLKSEDWSKEETDYLLEMVREYHQRWPVIADRWDFVPRSADSSEAPKPETDVVKAEPTDAEVPNSTDSTGNSSQPPQAIAKSRTVEELKHRYYTVSASLMALHHPVSNMNDAEFALHTTLTSYDPIQETTRKKLAASMLARGIDELKEEEYLIAELQRIMTSQHRLEAERAELRARLETAPQLRTMEGDYSSSAALNELFQRLINSSRSAKRSAQGAGPGGRLSLSAGDMLPSPAYANGTPLSGHARDSFGNKRGSLAGMPGSATSSGGGALSAGVPLRQPSPKTERRFGISAAADVKGNQGVTFPTDRISKARQAKSAVQTTKLYEALQSLRIPEVLPLPTVEVVEAFEELVAKVTRVNDARRVLEREEGDVRVVRNRRRESGLGGADGEEDEDGDATMVSAANDEEDAPGEDDDAAGGEDGEEEEEDDDADADGEADDYQDAEEEVEEDAEEDAEGEEEDAEGEEEEDDDDAEGEDEESALGEIANGVSQTDGAADLAEGEDGDESERPKSSSARPGTAVSHASVSTRASRKRSASVLSAGSMANSSKRTRR